MRALSARPAQREFPVFSISQRYHYPPHPHMLSLQRSPGDLDALLMAPHLPGPVLGAGGLPCGCSQLWEGIKWGAETGKEGKRKGERGSQERERTELSDKIQDTQLNFSVR